MKGKKVMVVAIVFLGIMLVIANRYWLQREEVFFEELEETVEKQEKEMIEPIEKKEPYESKLDDLQKESPYTYGENIGTLKIPVIALEMQVVENASPANLNKSLARMISSDLPGDSGNTVITGHRMYQFGSHFNRLDELKVGDEITFEDEQYRHVYEVESITFVEPSELWIMMGSNRERILTLVTCTPIARATHRLVIFSSHKHTTPL
ncbi:class D sortase [Tindallia californiensis]|uniref:Sortase A n=1 Tax=Tindallia californiensis TaxID=159292 RepID=A0A1H3K7W1_9FIRM|nr:class D sortase [Tindallia californiensis]SDY48286.1 sortase A [Tindallia californiensis]